jgi:hypothetical protein
MVLKKIDLDDIRNQVDEERYGGRPEKASDHSHENSYTNQDVEFLKTASGTISHYIKREISQRFRNVPVLGEVFMGHVENEADDPNSRIARGVRDMTKAEMLGEKFRRGWERFIKR